MVSSSHDWDSYTAQNALLTSPHRAAHWHCTAMQRVLRDLERQIVLWVLRAARDTNTDKRKKKKNTTNRLSFFNKRSAWTEEAICGRRALTFAQQQADLTRKRGCIPEESTPQWQLLLTALLISLLPLPPRGKGSPATPLNPSSSVRLSCTSLWATSCSDSTTPQL